MKLVLRMRPLRLDKLPLMVRLVPLIVTPSSVPLLLVSVPEPDTPAFFTSNVPPVSVLDNVALPVEP